MGKSSHAVHPFTDSELAKRASPGQLTLLLRYRSRPEPPSPHSPPQTTRTGEDFRGLAGTYTTGIPHSGNPDVITKPWAGKPLPSLLLSTSPKKRV